MMGLKHYFIPTLEKNLVGIHIMANSYSIDYFDLDHNYIDVYFRDLATAVNNAVKQNLNFSFYKLFRGEKPVITNALLDNLDKKNFDPSDASSNGYPMYGVRHTVEEIIQKPKPTTNELKNDITKIRAKLNEKKVELETIVDKVKEGLILKNFEIDVKNLDYGKLLKIEFEMINAVEDMIVNPKKYAPKSHENFEYTIEASDLVVMVSSDIPDNGRRVIQFNNGGIGAFGSGLPAGITVYERSEMDPGSVRIIHKDFLKVIVNKRYTKMGKANYEDFGIQNGNSTLGFMIGVIEELPCYTIKFKAAS